MTLAMEVRTEEALNSLSRLKIAIAFSGLGHIAGEIETWAADDLAGVLHAEEDVTLFQEGGEPLAPYAVTVPAWKPFQRKTQRVVELFGPSGGWRYGSGSGCGVEQTTFSLYLWRRIQRAYDIVHGEDPLVALIRERLQRAGLSMPRVILAHGIESPEMPRKYSFLQHLAPNYHVDCQKHRHANGNGSDGSYRLAMSLVISALAQPATVRAWAAA
jgi:hypothetical protein